MTLNVISKTFAAGQTLPLAVVFDGGGGENRSPHLAWGPAPGGTKSFAILLHDPDAPTEGVGFFHWVVYNLPGDICELGENAGAASGGGLPPGAGQGHNDFGLRHYAGPCPPPGHGLHHYNFYVYALDVPKLEASGATTGASLRFLLRDHVLAEGVLTGVYER